MFKRRVPRSWVESVGRFFYPRGGWSRASRYISYRLSRLPAPAHKIARGIACGVFISFTPFYGLHFLFSAGLAWLIRGNIIAALLATFFGNPITFPIIATLAVELGARILGQPPVPLPQIVAAFSYVPLEMWSNVLAIFTDAPMEWARLAAFFDRVFWPYLIGGLGPGILAGLVAFYVSRPLISAYQRARATRMARRLEKMRRAAGRADTAAEAK